jgi:hypothetical protein
VASSSTTAHGFPSVSHGSGCSGTHTQPPLSPPRPAQAQAAALDACRQLDATLGRRPCGSAALRNALSRAEGAAAALGGVPDTAPLSDACGARLQVRAPLAPLAPWPPWPPWPPGPPGSPQVVGAAMRLSWLRRACCVRGRQALPLSATSPPPPALQAGKRRLEVERAGEALHKVGRPECACLPCTAASHHRRACRRAWPLAPTPNP